MSDIFTMQQQVIIKNDKKVIVQQGHIRILHWEDAVVIRRDSTRRIPSDIELVANVKLSLSESDTIGASAVERILDKTIYYYFHFLMSQHKETKSHHYNGFLGLVSEMSRLGHRQECFAEAKAIAMEKKKQADIIIKGLSVRKDETPGLIKFRDLSRQYDQFRNAHTAYGEHVNPILSSLVKHWPIQFY